MRSRFVSGITTGAIIGAAASMMIVPQLSRGTRKRLRRSGKFMRNVAEGMYDNLMNSRR